jgi:hypothetical protein
MSASRVGEAVRARLRAQAGNRCGYCQSRQEYVFAPLEVEHIVPLSRGGSDDEVNLWLACRMCNSYKGAQVDAIDPVTATRRALFNPRTQSWAEHFTWADDGLTIHGLTPCGRATVAALQLNNLLAVTVRRGWVEAGWHPPEA